MKAILFFRFILIALILTTIISGVLDIVMVETLAHKLQVYLSSQSGNINNVSNQEAALFVLILIIIFIVIVVLSTILYLGVWNFKRWARTLLVIMMLFQLFTTPLVIMMLLQLLSTPLIGEAIIAVPWTYLFGNISVILNGILLVLMYTAPIRLMQFF